MTVWDELTGQAEAIEVFRAAAAAPTPDGPESSLTHSWLVTGPPGSGRSNLAFAFATALLSQGDPDGDEATRRQVEARTHPDLGVLSTERVIISIDEVRTLGLWTGERSLEADVMDWSDDIAYAVHDIEDFYRAESIPLSRLRQDDEVTDG